MGRLRMGSWVIWRWGFNIFYKERKDRIQESMFYDTMVRLFDNLFVVESIELKSKQ